MKKTVFKSAQNIPSYPESHGNYVELEKEIIGSRLGTQIPIECYGGIQNIKMRRLIDYSTDHVFIDMIAYVTKEHVEESRQTIKFEYPATWWEHLKQAFIRKYPFLEKLLNVKFATCYKTIQFNCDFVYPKLPLAMPGYNTEHFKIVSAKEW